MLEQMSRLGKAGVPFLFIIDFELKKPIILPLQDVDSRCLKYKIGDVSNESNELKSFINDYYFEKFPIDLPTYRNAYEYVVNQELAGNSFLTNLTFPTLVKTNLQFEKIFDYAEAPYKLWIKDKLVVFSPESFVKINQGLISSYPMKGTIRADIPDAPNKILNDPKELAEHTTIVDLIRNDLSQVARKIQVEKFRYLDKLTTHQGELWQVSSKITGALDYDWPSRLGEIFEALLPAGSVSGAPKPKTIDIIKKAEGEDRGYFTGVFGIFNGKTLDSGVMIRYLEQSQGLIYFRSGGGITIYSNLESEYQELIDKVYVPFNRKHLHSGWHTTAAKIS